MSSSYRSTSPSSGGTSYSPNSNFVIRVNINGDTSKIGVSPGEILKDVCNSATVSYIKKLHKISKVDALAMIEKQNIAVVSVEDDESEKDLDETIFRNGISNNDTLCITLSGFTNDHFPISRSLSFEPGNKFLASDIRKATQNFSARNVLGRGGQATVYKGSLFGSMVAVKRYTNIDFSEMDLEMKALQKVRHRNVILLMGYCPEEKCIISEFMEGASMQDKLEKKSAELSWAERYRITQEMVSAVYFIHSCGVLHRDLKPGNILFDSHGSVKVADMGLAKFSTATVTATGNFGTPGYMDPNVYLTGQTSRSLDVYALGLIILQLCTHTSNIEAIHEIFKSIPAGERRKSPHGISLFTPAMVQSDSSLPSEKAALLLEIGLECVEYDPTNRPTMEALIERLGKVTIPETIQQPLASSAGNGFEKALLDRARRGDPHDQFELGRFYEKGSGGVDKDEVEALYWYDMAARQRLVDASNALWILCFEKIYLKLLTEKEDQAHRVLLLKQSNERNIACASFCLAICYKDGIGVAEDPQMAVSLCTKAASQGHAVAQLTLGIYYRSEGVVEDEDKAQELWAKALEWSTGAAAEGYLMAMKIFIVAFYFGYGVNRDSVKLTKWKSDYDSHHDRHRSLYG